MALNVGDKLYFNINHNSRSNEEVEIKSVKIDKVGRKYFSAGRFDRINRVTLVNEVKDYYQYNTPLFISEEEAKKHYELLETKSKFFRESNFSNFVQQSSFEDLEIVRLVMSKYK